MFLDSKKKVGLFVCSMALAASANATTNTELDLSEVVQAASTIVAGEVVSSTTKMQGKAATTVISVRVTDEIKGDTPEIVEISVPGGSYTSGRFRIGETHAGAPSAFANQKSVYFLSNNASQGGYDVVGFNQGIIAIEPTANGDMVRGMLTQGQSISLTEMKARIDDVEAN